FQLALQAEAPVQVIRRASGKVLVDVGDSDRAARIGGGKPGAEGRIEGGRLLVWRYAAVPIERGQAGHGAGEGCRRVESGLARAGPAAVPADAIVPRSVRH